MKPLLLSVAMLLYTITNFAQTSQGFVVENSNAYKVMTYLKTPSATDNHVVMVAHRGGFAYNCALQYNGSKYYFPENTLGAILAANVLNIEATELDIKVSSDGIPMLSHDWTIGRMFDPSFNPNNASLSSTNGKVADYAAADLRSKISRSLYVNPTNNTFAYDANRLTFPNVPNMYNMVSLETALNFIISNKMDIVVVLDVKAISDAKKCLDVVTKLNANNWVIFKLNADALFKLPKGDNSQAASYNGNSLGYFEQQMQLNISTDGTTQYGPRILNLVPMYTTNQVNKLQAFKTLNGTSVSNPAGAAMLNSFDILRNKPYFFSAEVDVKEGYYGTTTTDANRYTEMAKLASGYGGNYKIGTFHALRDAQGTPNFNGSFFDGSDGHCCYSLPEKLYDYTKETGAKLVRNDVTDNRWDQNFNQGALIAADGGTYGYKMRWLASDDPLNYIDFLKSKSLRNSSYTLNTNQLGNTSNINISAVNTIPTINLPADLSAFKASGTDDYTGDLNKPYFNAATVTKLPNIPAGATIDYVATNGYYTFLADANNSLYNTIYTVDESTTPYTYTSLPVVNNLYSIAVDTKSNLLAIVSTTALAYKDIYKYSPTTNQWTLLTIPFNVGFKIAAGGFDNDGNDAGNIVWAALSNDGKIYTSSPNTPTIWTPLGLQPTTAPKEIAVDEEGTVWYIDAVNNIYKWNSATNAYVQISGKQATKISAGNDGAICIVGTDNNVYSYNGACWQLVSITYTGGNSSTIKEFALENNTDLHLVLQDGTTWEAAYITPVTISGTLGVCGNINNATQLSYPISGGVWTSSNPAIASVNRTTGLVTSGSTSGNATITYGITDAAGCNYSTSTVVKVFAPSITASGVTTFCNGQSVTLTATDGTSYNWSNGATTQSITVSPTVTTSYTVTVGGLNASGTSCSVMSKPFTVTVLPGVVNSKGNALNFDGSNDYVSVSNGYAATSELTYELWVNPSAFNSSGFNVLLNHNNWSTGYVHFQFQNNQLVFGLNSGPVGNFNQFFNINTWYHVAVVYSVTARTLKFYVNGILDNTITTGNFIAIPANLPYTIGAWNGGRYFNGTMDEIRIWNIARTQAQIQGAMNTELLGTESGLVAYYNCNQGITGGANTGINSLIDNTNNFNNGTLLNFNLSSATTSNWVAGNAPTIASTIWAGSSLQLNNTIAGGGTWTTSNTSVATVSSTGLVTAPLNAPNGTATITYTANTISATCSNAANTIVTVNALPVISGSTNVCVNAKTTLTSNILGGYWETSTSEIANVNAQSGVVTGKSAGNCTISYTVTKNGYKAVQTYNITVNPSPSVEYSVVQSFNAYRFNAPQFYVDNSYNPQCKSGYSFQWYYDFNTISSANVGYLYSPCAYYFYRGYGYRPSYVGLQVTNNATGCVGEYNVRPNATSGGIRLLSSIAVGDYSASTNNICKGAGVTLTTDNEDTTYGYPLMYLWSTDPDGLNIVGDTSTITIYPDTTATYYVTIIDSNGNFATSPSGLLVTVNNTPTISKNTGNALRFDGANDYVNLGTSSVFNIANAITVEAWVKVNAFTIGWQAIVTKGDDSWRLSRYQESNFVGFSTNGLSNVDLGGTTNINDGKWHHIAGVFDGTRKYIYVDGKLDASVAVTGTIATSTYPVNIGYNAQRPGVRYFNGSIDEVRVWNLAKTQVQIQAALNKELAGTESGLVAYYNFNQGIANGTNAGISTLLDKTANANNGTLTDFELSGTTSNWVAGTSFGNSPATTNQLSFDGVDDYVTVSPNVYFNGNFTIEAMVYPRSFNNWSRIIDFGNGAGVNSIVLAMSTGTNGYPLLRVEGAQFQSTTPFLLNQWNHVAATLNGTTASIYINGILAGTATLETPVNIMRNLCYIGKSNWASDGYTNATMDEVRIWNTVRTQTQIQTNMNSELATTDTAGLVAYYNFNQGAAGGSNNTITNLSDNSKYGNDGTLTNFALSGNTSNWVTDNTVGTATATICTGTTLQLNNVTTGGTWLSSNTNVASVNSSTGVVSGVANGTATISYTVSNVNGCSAVPTSTVVTVIAAPTVASNTGNALNFDGSNDYVNVTRKIQDDFSIEFWMKTTQTGPSGSQWYNGYGLVDAEVGGVTNDFGLSLVGSKIAFGVGNPDNTIFSASNVNAGNWVHVVATRSKTNGLMQLFINGVLEASYTTSNRNSLTAPANIALGRLQTGIQYFNGSLDDIRLWNAVRTQAQIQAAINTELVGTETGLVGYYNCNQGIASGSNAAINSLIDKTSNVNNGTLTNFALTVTSSNWVAGNGSTSAISLCNGNTIQLNNTTSGGTWSSTNTNIATVNTTGLVTVISSGSATINYIYANANGCTATAATTVTGSTTTVTANQIAKTSICTGETVAIWNGVAGGTWSSSNPSVADVSVYNTVKGASAGTATVTYTLTNGSGCTSTASTLITVSNLSMSSFNGATGNKVAISSTGVVWQIGTDGYIYRWIGSWSQRYKGLSAISLAVDNNGIPWIIGSDGKIYYFYFNTSQWTSVSSTTGYKKIASSNGKIVVIAADNSIYQLNQTSGSNPVVGTLVAYFYPTYSLSQIYNNSQYYPTDIAVSSTGIIWFLDPYKNMNYLDANNVRQIAGCNCSYGTRISCGQDGSVFISGTDNKIYQYDAPTNNWIQKAAFGLANNDFAAYQSYVLMTVNSGAFYVSSCFAPNLSNNDKPTATATAQTITDELAISNNIRIYPNPAHDKVTVQLVQGMEKATVTIISALGTTIATDNTTGLQRVINLVGKPSGTYLVRVTTKGHVSTTQKLIIQ